ncbi:MAG TPA: tetratricopeptide repeat protein [Streptosporangiaceae bacterium]|nr:tetratricopeptide repeat protein [Streptosporangiaceae bacterium]
MDGATGGQAFGGVLRSRRIAAGLTQEGLAERAGLGVRTIRDLERGRVRRPHRDSVGLLASALGLTSQAREELARAGGQPPTTPALPDDGAGVPVPRQLPPAIQHFTGRAPALKALTELIGDESATSATVVISAIDGTAGVGKTALALHWAHQVADRFPDGQLYVNLRGFDPGGPPLPPAEAVRGFLDALGVPPGQVPAGLEALTAQYRSLLAGRRVLVVLDNARDAAQARPLLPGSANCLVVVTSRARLLSLVAAEGAVPITLDLLTVDEARELLVRRLGRERVEHEQDAADELIVACAGLPLALNIVAARAASEPTWALADLACQLRDTQSRLDVLNAGDPLSDARAVFSWSYQHLSAPAARMFRLLGGVHPGPGISLPAAASLAAVPLRQARLALDELTTVRLLTEQPPGRFYFHDLLRAYAAEQAQALDNSEVHHAARCRMLDHYLHTTWSAIQVMYPHREPLPLAAPQPGVLPEDLNGDAAVLSWLDAEYPVLLAATAMAADARLDTYAWQLPLALAEFFSRRGHWEAFAATQGTALAAAQRLADPRAQASAHIHLGVAYGFLGAYDRAATHLDTALDLYRQLGDRMGEVSTATRFAHLLGLQGRNREARDHARRALALCRDEGQPRVFANRLADVGWFNALMGDYHQALADCQQALEIIRGLGDRLSHSAVLHTLGYVHHHLGHHEQAVCFYEQALRLTIEIGDRHRQATTLVDLGDTHHAWGDTGTARQCWQQALAIFTTLNHPDADAVRGKLSCA